MYFGAPKSGMNSLILHAYNTLSVMKRRIISSLVLRSGIFLITLMISCGKDGAEGPAGPKGEAAGSEVIYSEWLDMRFKADTIHKSGGRIDTIGYYAVIDAPKLTTALLSTADVKVYLNYGDASAPVIYALPYTFANGIYIETYAYTQKIELYSNVDWTTTFSNNGKKYHQFRYMILPGNTQARIAAPVSWSNYAEVKAYLGLKD